jgi:hypothetical protein
MAFGTEYSTINGDVHFGMATEAQLATLEWGEEDFRYLGRGLQRLLQKPDQFHDYLAGPHTESWAIMVGQRAAGVAVIHSFENDPSVDEDPFVRTVIASEFQGLGLSKLAHGIRLSEWFLRRGQSSLKSYVHPENERNRANVLNRGYYRLQETAEDAGVTYDTYLAVNPYDWKYYHQENPHESATPETLARVLATLSLMENLQLHNSSHRPDML